VLKKESATINGQKYEVTQLPYSAGHRLLLRLYKVLGPALAEAFANAPDLKDSSIGDLPLRKIGPALGAAATRLAQDLSEEDFDHMVETLAEYTRLIDDTGRPKKLDADAREFHFAGNYLELFQWLGFALRVNYLGFSNGRDVLTQALARAREIAAQSPSQTE
jgi:hypothetical protein